MTNLPFRLFSSKETSLALYCFHTNSYNTLEATKQVDTSAVKLRGTLLKSRNYDMPTMIWLPELTEPAENFASFFNGEKNKIKDLRNVWLLDYRNQGDSDHHESYDMDVR